MKTPLTVLLVLLAVAAIVFLAIYEPLTRSTREEAGDAGLAVNLDPAKIDGIKVVTGDEYFEIKRRGEGWQIGPEHKDRADAKLVARLLETVSRQPYFDRIRASELPNDKALNEYGLRNPKRRIEISGGEGRTTLFLGKDAADDESLYLRTDKGREVYVVSDDLFEVVFRRPEDFRDRRLSDLDPGHVERITIRQENGEIELLRGPTGWRLVKPLDASADAEKVEKFLTDLLGLQIEQFVADDTGDLGTYGIIEGRNEISIRTDDSDRSQTLRLGTLPAGNSQGVLAQFTVRDSVYRLPRKAADLLAVMPEALRDRRLLPVNLDLVDAIRIESPAGTIHLERKGEGWTVRAGEAASAADPEAVQRLVGVLSSTQVENYLPTSVESVQAAPRCTVIFLSRLSENTPEAAAGDYVVASVALVDGPNGQLLARVSQGPEFAVIPPAVLDSILLKTGGWAAK